MLASPPIDFHVTDTYFVVAHFHHVLFGTIVFSTFAGIYFWFPKMTGGLLDERLSKLHFWLTFIAFPTTFPVQHWLGDEGMPRRYAPPTGSPHSTSSLTIGAFILALSMLPFMWNVFKRLALRRTRHRRRIPGVTATHWSGPPAARRGGTTSPHCPASAPSARPSNCTTHTWWSRCARGPHRPQPPRCTADAIQEWQLFLRRISPSVSSRTGRSAPTISTAIPACVPVTAAKALMETFGCDGQRGSSPDVDLADVISLFGHNVAET